METLALVLIALSVVVVLGLAALIAVLVGVGRQESRTRAQQREDLDAASRSRALAESDVALLRTDLSLLTTQVTDLAEDDTIVARLQGLSEEVDALSLRLTHAGEPADVTAVTKGLADTREALGVISAELAGESGIVNKPPCFFNPNHGPSSTVVAWTDEAGKNVRVPSCDADANRLRSGAAPYARTVSVEGERLPWWDAGSSVRPWARGWYHLWLTTEAAQEQATLFASLAPTDGSGRNITAVAPEAPARRAEAS